MQKRYEEIV